MEKCACLFLVVEEFGHLLSMETCTLGTFGLDAEKESIWDDYPV